VTPACSALKLKPSIVPGAAEVFDHSSRQVDSRGLTFGGIMEEFKGGQGLAVNALGAKDRSHLPSQFPDCHRPSFFQVKHG
jgi:hypothetical protein